MRYFTFVLIALLTTSSAFATYLGNPVNIKGGGTGLATLPSAGQILIGNAGGTAYALALLNGEASMSSTGAVTLANSAVIGKVLTGYVSGAGTITAGDTILSAIQKLNGNTAAAGITALTGDVTASGSGSVAATIAANAVTNAKAAQMAAHTFKGNNTGATANALDLTASQVKTDLAIACADITNASASCTIDTSNASNISSGTLSAARLPAFSGDATSSAGTSALTLATVNSNVGSFTNASITVDAKGRITAASTGSASGSPLTTKGDLFTRTTVDARLPVGTNGQILSANSAQTTGLEWIAAPSSTATSNSITQTAHGFAVGDWIYYTGSAYAKAKADADSTSEVVGVVSVVTDANTFTLTHVGFLSGLSGLTAGTTYYLSPTTAGALTSTSPVTIGQINKPLFVAASTTTGYVLQSRGYLVGGGNGPQLVISDWTAFTPTYTGFGTVSTQSSFYRRVGDSLEIQIKFLAGSPTATEARISLPSGLTVDSAKMTTTAGSIHLVGILGKSSTSGTQNYFANLSPANTYLTFGESPDGNSALQQRNGDAFSISSGDAVSVTVRGIPISGWTATSSGSIAAPRSEVIVDTGNGHGSSNTKVRRFVNIRKNVGAAITYADSASLGGTFTVNEDGVYSVNWSDRANAAGTHLCVVVNGTALSTACVGSSITYAQGHRSHGDNGASNNGAGVSWTGNLKAGDIVYPQDDGSPNSTGDDAIMTVAKVSN